MEESQETDSGQPINENKIRTYLKAVPKVDRQADRQSINGCMSKSKIRSRFEMKEY